MVDTFSTHENGSILGEIHAIWDRRKWLLILAFAIPLAFVINLIFAMPDLYRATATVLVQADNPVDSFASSQIDTRLQTITENILSRNRLLELIDKFNLYPELRQKNSPGEVVKHMRQDIRLERKNDDLRLEQGATVAFTLSYQGWDPRVVADVTNSIVAMYVEKNEKLRPRKVFEAPSAVAVDPLTQLKRELVQLRTIYSEKYPDVIRVKEEIDALEQQRKDTGRTGLGTTQLRLKKPSTDSETQFLVIDSALVPTTPVAPNRNRLFVVGIMLAIGIAGIAVLIAEQYDTTFHNPNALWEYTKIPVLAGISPILTRVDVWRHRLRFGIAGVMTLFVAVVIIQVSQYVGHGSSQLVWMLAQRGI